MEANRLAEQIQECMKIDRELVDQYHAIDHGRWYGMGLSEHIGFTKWNEDEARNHIRRHSTGIHCRKGINKLRIYAVSPGFVLEKLVIYPEGKQPADSYLGPTETYYIVKRDPKS